MLLNVSNPKPVHVHREDLTTPEEFTYLGSWSALNTSAPRLSCPGDFSFSRELMAALIFSWGISVDIQVSRCLLYICFFWWWFVCSEYHFVLPCLTYKLVHEYLLVCSCHSLHFLARFPLLLIYLSFCWPQRLSSSEFFCLQWLLRYPL